MPFVRFTERPDICAAHLLEGHIAIIVDTSPSVILVPAPIFHHLQHAEEYRQAPLIGTIVRLMRLVGAVLSLFFCRFGTYSRRNSSIYPISSVISVRKI